MPMQKLNNINYDLGKIPPQVIEFEEAVLGAIMLESEAFIRICDIIKSESFYKEQHQKIFSACKSLFSKNKPIDILGIMEELRILKILEEIGGPAYLTQLMDNIGSSSHIEFHARIVQQKYIQRELIRISTEIQQKSFEDIDDIQELIDYAESELFNITAGNISKEPRKIEEIGNEQLILLEELSVSNNEFTGIPTGLTSLDRILNGLQNKKLMILAGRPGQGKTTLMISIARNMAIYFKKRVAIFSLEMGEDELWKKIISDLTDIQYARLNNKITDEWSIIESAQRQLEGIDLFIDDSPSISIFDLRAKARRLKMKKDIEIIFIDYLQLMSGNKEKGTRELEISSISRGLKILSKELNIPIVCISQLNRATEQRPDKKPQLSDLRESGAIEQDADIVSFIYRPEYYGFTQDENGDSTENRVDILIRKHRGGKTGDVTLWKTDNFTRIHDDIKIENIKSIDNSDINSNNFYEKDSPEIKF